MSDSTKTVAIVLAGGRGSRMGSSVPKQYMDVNGRPLIYYSLKAFEDSIVDSIVVVCGKGDEDFVANEIVKKYEITKVSSIVSGGKERYHSVANGLRAIDNCEIVLIHDGARPMITTDIIKRAYDETIQFGATVVGVPVKDTIKVATADGFSDKTLERDLLWTIQTPQSFEYISIRKAYDRLIDEEEELVQKNIKITDDAMVMELFGNHKVKLVMGSYSNIKVTTPEDILLAGIYVEETK